MTTHTTPTLPPLMVTSAATGQPVSTSSEEWRVECLQRHRHVLTMRSLDRLRRHDYVLDVRRKEGDLSADRLIQAYGDDLARRKATAAAVVAAADPAARP